MTSVSEPIRMEVRGLILDPSSNTPIVILRDEDNQIFLPIWIGIFEANAIALRIEGVEPPRPMTHDLLFASLQELGAVGEKVTITDLKDNTFYAMISLLFDSSVLAIDSRPSDALALALRAEAPIFVLRSVLETAKAVDLAGKMPDEDQLRKWLEAVDPDELGKYKM